MNSRILLEFKKLLKAARLKAGLNYKELAKISGVSDKILSKFENELELDIPTKKLFYLLNLLQVPKASIIQLIQLNY